jgi:antitoxin ParD1/3/4
MNITLPPEQQKWLEAEVAAGRFASIDDAIATAVAELMSIDADGSERAEPDVEEPRTSLSHAELMSGEEALRRLESRLGKLPSS